MPKPNAYLARQQAFARQLLSEGVDFGIQQTFDVMTIALHGMGWGKKRLLRLRAAMERILQEYRLAWAHEPESDYRQHILDESLREIFGDDMESFEKRYPQIKQWNYNKRSGNP